MLKERALYLFTCKPSYKKHFIIIIIMTILPSVSVLSPCNSFSFIFFSSQPTKAWILSQDRARQAYEMMEVKGNHNGYLSLISVTLINTMINGNCGKNIYLTYRLQSIMNGNEEVA